MLGKVLLIAINTYQECRSLAGSQYDAEDIYKTLVRTLGHDPRRIRYLSNELATRSEIIDALHWISDTDNAFCFYAGHGTLTLDNKPALLTYDFKDHWTNPLSQAEITYYISKIKKGLFIYDCCHSGSLCSGGGIPSLLRGNAAEEEVVERFVPNPCAGEDRGIDFSHIMGLTEKTMSDNLHISSGDFIYLSACGNEETSKEIKVDGVPRGIFTHSFCANIRRNPRAGLKELWEQTAKDVDRIVRSRGVSPQHPQLWTPQQYLALPLFAGNGV